MKRLLLAIALLLGLADVAAAQNVTCATRPVTDNSNACANTAFVNSVINSPSSPIYTTAHTWSATQTFQAVSGVSTNVVGPNSAAGPITDTATLAKFYEGSSGTPVTTAVPSVAISRYEAVNTDTQGVQNPALLVEAIGNNVGGSPTPDPQTLAIRAFAEQKGTGDVLGIASTVIQNNAQPNSGRFAYGYYANVWAKGSASAAYGMETHIFNDAAATPYATGTTPYHVGAVYFAGGAFKSTAGIYFAPTAGSTQQWDVGIAFRAGSIATATLWDDSSSVTTLRDKGSHTDGIDLSAATYSGSPFKSTGFSISPTGALVATSVVTPAVTGGSAANSALILKSTSSGAPSGDVAYLEGSAIVLRNQQNAATLVSIGAGGQSHANLQLSGSTSGSTTLTPLTTASGTLTVPSATDTLVARATTDTLTNKSISGSSNTLTNIPNSALVNASTTVNGQACTLGASCTVTAAAASVTVGTTTIASGTNGYVLYNNAGTLGNLANTGSGNNVLATSPALTTPAITTNIQPASDGGADLGTSSLRWGTGFVNTITASGQAARTWSMARNVTAATAGQNLTVQAGGAVSGGTDLLGGDLILSTGTATGAAGTTFQGNAVRLYAAQSGQGSGTMDRSPTEVVRFAISSNYGYICFLGTACNNTNYAFLQDTTGADKNIYIGTVAGGTVALRIAGNQGLALDTLFHWRTPNTTAPGLSSCGTSPSISGNDVAGEVTMGTSATGCIITFNAAYVAAPYCTVTWQNTPLASQSYTVSTTAITLTQTSTSSNKVNYHCLARVNG